MRRHVLQPLKLQAMREREGLPEQERPENMHCCPLEDVPNTGNTVTALTGYVMNRRNTQLKKPERSRPVSGEGPAQGDREAKNSLRSTARVLLRPTSILWFEVLGVPVLGPHTARAAA